MQPVSELELDDIQGVLLSGYGHLNNSRYLFLQITDADAAKIWLNQLVPTIATANWQKAKPTEAVNLALTYRGLKALGLAENRSSTPAEFAFSPEFCEGMAARAERLGDRHNNSPEHWELKFRMGERDFEDGQDQSEQDCHLLLILQAKDCPKLDQLYRQQQQQMGGVKVLHNLTGEVPRKDHFGFNDTVSQPDIEGSPILIKKLVQQPALVQDVIKAGEFILGYLNEDQQFPATPTVPCEWDTEGYLQLHPKRPDLRDLGRNGSYLVVRQLEQHVGAFRQFLQSQSDKQAQQELIAAKMVGRWPSGAPLVLHPETDPAQHMPQGEPYKPENRFGYRSLDAAGLRCPLGAHIRRVNPRDALGADRQSSGSRKHRILRRGALYGDPLPEGEWQDDGQKRGLLFMAINANLQQQFEFIQTMWINNARFSNLNSETDPLIGTAPSAESKQRQFTVQQQPVRQRLMNLPDFVTLKGGGYFFLPSLSALWFLAALKMSHPIDLAGASQLSTQVQPLTSGGESC